MAFETILYGRRRKPLPIEPPNVGLAPHTPDAARYVEIRFTAEMNSACEFSPPHRRAVLRAAFSLLIRATNLVF